jgi:hypothetical protein
MRSTTTMATLLALALSAGGCAPSDEDADDPIEWVDGKADGVIASLSVTKINTKAIFDALSFEEDGLLVLGRSVKFLIDARSSSPKVYFMNAKYTDEGGKTPDSARFHYYFAEAILKSFTDDLGTFNHDTYDVQDKRFVAGTIQVYNIGGSITYGIQLYPQDVAAEDTIYKAVKIVKAKLTIPSATVAFVSTGPQQTQATIGSKLAAIKVGSKTIDQILGSLDYLPMNLGDAYGFLRMFPKNDELTAMDIPVFDELPLDLAVVAGTITRAFQDASAHVNLKSKERGTPNMVLRSAGPTQAVLAPFVGKPVHLIVTADGFKLLPSTETEVKKKLKERTDKPWVPLTYVERQDLLGYREMCPGAAKDCIALNKAYGSKAANLGFLQHRAVLGQVGDAGSLSKALGYSLVPIGFGIPIAKYNAFVEHAPNQALRDAIADLVTSEKAGTLSVADRISKVKVVQDAFYVAEMPPGLVDEVKAKLGEVAPGIKKFKFRSSANAEDLPNFDGAGLYDSFSANNTKVDNADGSCQVITSTDVTTKLDMEPNTVACAMKGVFASVWNRRAVEERSFARLDHETAGMGIAVVPKYDLESDVAANAVVITRVIGSQAVFGYSFSTQVGNNLVTNPEPGTLSESTVAAFLEPGVTAAPSFIITRYATPVMGMPARTTAVLSDADSKTLLRISKTVELAYCKAQPTYYSDDCTYVSVDRHKPKSIDMEFKLLANGEFVAKQMREFAGR